MRGSITYNGETFDSFQVARTSAYISQDDNHQAELTVRETLDFAARCLGVGHKQGESGLAVARRQALSYSS
jgi:ABC-type multidrug transport system ATPase subunit